MVTRLVAGRLGRARTSSAARTAPLITAPKRRHSRSPLYCHDDVFRSTVNMARHRFGEGEYRYFAYPFSRSRRLAAGAVPPAAADRRDWHAEARAALAVAGHARRVAGDVPCRGADQAHGDAAQLREGRLERAAPRSLRRPRLPPPGRDQPQPAGESTTPAASSCSSSSGRERNPAAPPRRCPIARAGVHDPRPSRRVREGMVAAPVRHGVSIVRSGKRLTLGICVPRRGVRPTKRIGIIDKGTAVYATFIGAREAEDAAASPGRLSSRWLPGRQLELSATPRCRKPPRAPGTANGQPRCREGRTGPAC